MAIVMEKVMVILKVMLMVIYSKTLVMLMDFR
jgi:hypothetical protein